MDDATLAQRNLRTALQNAKNARRNFYFSLFNFGFAAVNVYIAFH